MIFSRLLFATLGLTLAACEPAPLTPTFGAAYELVLNDSPGGPDTPPRLQGDYLLATLGYGGGCSDHDFSLGYTVRRDTAHVWIIHDDGGDTCEAWLLDELHLELPTAVRDAGVIALHPPDGDVPYLLRWGPDP
jgi:hypothetical protein